MSHVGRYRELRQRVDEYMVDAQRRANLYASTTFIRNFSTVWLVEDDPAEALARVEATTWTPLASGYQFQHWVDCLARGEIDLYSRSARGSLARLEPHFAGLRSSYWDRHVHVRSLLFWLRGRLALAEAEADSSPGFRREASRSVRRLRRAENLQCGVWWRLLDAGLAHGRGDDAAAVHLLREAITAAEVPGLLPCAAAARRRLGALLGGPEGAALIAEADAWYASEGVKNPARFTDMLAPGFGRSP